MIYTIDQLEGMTREIDERLELVNRESSNPELFAALNRVVSLQIELMPQDPPMMVVTLRGGALVHEMNIQSERNAARRDWVIATVDQLHRNVDFKIVSEIADDNGRLVPPKLFRKTASNWVDCMPVVVFGSVLTRRRQVSISFADIISTTPEIRLIKQEELLQSYA